MRATSRPRQDVVLGCWSEVVERPVAELTTMIESRLAQLREARTMLPQASVTVWPNSGHFPHLARCNAFATILEDTARW